MGRPTKLTEERQKTICQAVALGVPEEAAAASAGIDPRTFYYWMSRGKEANSGIYLHFFQAVKKALAESEAALVKTIRIAATETWQAAAWLLERRFPSRYARMEKRELSGPEGKPVEVSMPADPQALRAELVGKLASPGVLRVIEGGKGAVKAASGGGGKGEGKAG